MLALCRALLRAGIGYFWLAIREDQEAAQALGIDIFRYKMGAVVLSAALTAFGGAIYAFYDNNLYPDDDLHVGALDRDDLGAIIGGLGTLFGPDRRRVPADAAGRGDDRLGSRCRSARLDGLKQCSTASPLVAIVLLQRRGVWPWLARSFAPRSAARGRP